MTFAPAFWAASIAGWLSAPGCIQMCLMPSCRASSTTFSVTFGGVMIDTPSTERAVGELVDRLASERGNPVKVRFDNPDVILAIEIIGSSTGLALITRERRRFPFVKVG